VNNKKTRGKRTSLPLGLFLVFLPKTNGIVSSLPPLFAFSPRKRTMMSGARLISPCMLAPPAGV